MNLPLSVKTWIEEILETNKLKIEQSDFSRPWGGFFVLAADSLKPFVQLFFKELATTSSNQHRRSPKILFVAPHKRLSWQYHHRRSEVWRVIKGKVAIIRSMDDNERPQEVFIEGDKIELKCGERHRLVGLDDWGVVAEIWQHTDSAHLSDENDIVRVQDDYNRGSP